MGEVPAGSLGNGFFSVMADSAVQKEKLSFMDFIIHILFCYIDTAAYHIDQNMKVQNAVCVEKGLAGSTEVASRQDRHTVREKCQFVQDNPPYKCVNYPFIFSVNQIIIHIKKKVNRSLNDGGEGMKVQRQIPMRAYHAEAGFIADYQKLIREKVLPYQYEILCDRAEGAEKSHVIRNFINAGKALRGEDIGDGFYGMVFQDSDAAKWLEAAAYSLTVFPDEELEKTADELIFLIEQAQDEDGYLNTCFTIKDRDRRWQNLLEGHELYCSGHMMEAAVAYYEATGKDRLLKVMERNMEHIYHHFIEEGHEGYPGHPEVELALLKMYRATGNPHCLELAAHFLDVRGVDPAFYEKEAEKRDWQVWGNDPTNHAYQQSQAPVRELKEATGHSVRAVYLYTAMADMASQTGDEKLYEACRRLWENITEKRMYVTGGIGSTVLGEAFTVDYDLPCDTAYAETCASAGLMFFASRMLENEVKGEYADICELAFYNTVLAGMQLDGTRFFYVNPLEVIPGIAGEAATHKHDLPRRPRWYACACCPPNVARTITSFGKYAYGVSEDTAYCHLFAAGKVEFPGGLILECRTDYPMDFTVDYEILKGGKCLAVRIPGWSEKYQILRGTGDGVLSEVQPEIRDGYAYLTDVKEGERIRLILDGTPGFVYGSSNIPDVSGMAAVQRGPLVYCFEGVDNDGEILSLALKEDGKIEEAKACPGLPARIPGLKVQAYRRAKTEGLYTRKRPAEEPCTAYAVPYFCWGNRGENQMRVWMPEHK